MFSGQKEKTVPKDLKECYQTDSVTHNLWTWAERLEIIGKIMAIITAVSVIISGAIIDDTGYWDGIMFLISIASAPIAAFFTYVSYHVIALLVSSLASIVQHIKITANLNLYNSSKEDISNDNVEKSTYTENNNIKNAKLSSNIQPPYWCANCGTEGPFEECCPQCGRRIKTYTKPQSKPDTAKILNNLKKYWDCEKCGATNLETERHCWSCGADKQ